MKPKSCRCSLPQIKFLLNRNLSKGAVYICCFGCWSSNGVKKKDFQRYVSGDYVALFALKRSEHVVQIKKKRATELALSADFHKSREWLELRYQAFLRLGRKCQCCGAVDTILQVDHIKPRSKFPNLALDINNLQILCRDCNLGKSNLDSSDFRSKSEDIRANERIIYRPAKGSIRNGSS